MTAVSTHVESALKTSLGLPRLRNQQSHHLNSSHIDRRERVCRI